MTLTARLCARYLLVPVFCALTGMAWSAGKDKQRIRRRRAAQRRQYRDVYGNAPAGLAITVLEDFRHATVHLFRETLDVARGQY